MKSFIRHSFAVLMMVSLGYASYGKPVDVNTAMAVGANFLVSDGVNGVQSATGLTLAYTATSTVNGNTVVDYYIFNINAAKGFVIVAGDDNIIPILAYSRQSSFNYEKISPVTKDWIDGYKNQITAAIANNIPAKTGTAEKWAGLQTATNHIAARTTAVGGDTGLVATRWDQDGGGGVQYDEYCPNTATTGGLSATGCVATAMAQLMKFWNWPTVGCGSHTYYDAYDASEGSGSNETLTVDYGNTAYNWAGMPLTSSNAAVATLMYHAGVSVDMSYGYNGSGAYVTLPETDPVNCAEYALKTYFHYKNSLHNVLRFGLETGTAGSYYEGQDYVYYSGSVNIDSLNETAWITLLQNELNLGRPMLYEGDGSDGGHCWICDGWETTDDMFHFNWGWSGESDGFFTVDNLAPPALGVGGGSGNFNNGQGVVMGVVPDSFPSNPGNIELLAHLDNPVSSPAKYGTPFTITTKIKNTGTTAFTGSFGIAAYDTANNQVAVISTLPASVAAGDSSAALTFTCAPYALVPNMFNGLRVLYEPTGSSTWTPVANNGTFINYTEMNIINDSNIVLYDSLHVGSHTILPGAALNITTTIGNQGGSIFSNGTLQAVLVNALTGAIYTVQAHTGETIHAYAANNYTFSNTSITAPYGLYALEIQYEATGVDGFNTVSSDYYMNPVLITIKDTATATTGVASVNTANDFYVYPNPAKSVINVLMQQGADVTSISMMDVQGHIVKSVDAAAISSTLVTLPVADLASGDYFVRLQTSSGVVTKKIVIAK